jgi:hypothetical protein
MDSRLWRFTAKAADMKEWNDSQDILNEMFYAQKPVPKLHPELNYQPFVDSPIGLGEAHFVHLNSTRSHLNNRPYSAVQRMREMVEEMQCVST